MNNSALLGNSINEYAYVVDDGYNLFFNIGNLASFNSDKINYNKATILNVAEHYWELFTKYL